MAVAADLQAAAALRRERGGPAQEAARLLETRTPALVAYLEALPAALRQPGAQLGAATVAFLAWAWQHRQALGVRAAREALPAAPAAADQVWAVLERARRGTGMVENRNRVLAFHRTTHRGLPATVLATGAVYRNHRV